MIDLKLENVSKRYRIRREEATHHEGLLRRLKSRLGPGKDFWALRDVNLEVRAGETLGIIGHNGSGKSTILKLLSRISAPSDGEITIRGRVAAMLEVASGFHPELTGRENIFLAGSIIGMKRREIHTNLDRIMDFAEIRPFIDLPVKRYSSGMYVRLGFSIAAHMRPDILLLDEVLAVGDMSFQRKCMDHILKLKRGGLTMIFISHDLAAVERLCDRAVLLERGQIVTEGPPGVLAGQYLTRIEPSSDDTAEGAAREVRLRGLEMLDEFGRPALQFRTGYPLRARIDFEASAPISGVRFRLLLSGVDDQIRCEFACGNGEEPVHLPAGPGAIEFACGEIGLQPGIYQVGVRVENASGTDLDWKQRWAAIHVADGKPAHGAFYCPHTWRLDTAPAPGPGLQGVAGGGVKRE